MASRQDRGAHVRAQWDKVGWDDLATFIGPNAERFRKTWTKSRERVLSRGYANVLSFSWPVLFFSFAWFFARKQWAAGALIVILPILLAFLFHGLPGGAMTGISIAMAGFAKNLYLQTSVPKVARILDDSVPGPDRDARLRAAGGISPMGAVGGAALLALMLSAAIYTVMQAY